MWAQQWHYVARAMELGYRVLRSDTDVYLAEDPYQMTNLYPSTDAATKAALHAKLSAYYGCAGADCP